LGKLNFRGYLILQFYPTREIRIIDAHEEYVFYSRPTRDTPYKY